MKPLVRIGLMTYNRAHYLPKVIDCWLSQTYGNIELLISDDASTDETQKICEDYEKRYACIRYFRQEKNLNAPGCYKFILNQVRSVVRSVRVSLLIIHPSLRPYWHKHYIVKIVSVLAISPPPSKNRKW